VDYVRAGLTEIPQRCGVECYHPGIDYEFDEEDGKAALRWLCKQHAVYCRRHRLYWDPDNVYAQCDSCYCEDILNG